MRKGWHVAWIAIGILSAISIAGDWYSGKAADTPVWMLAIYGALCISMHAAERAFPSLRD